MKKMDDRWPAVNQEWWDEYEDEREKLFLAIVLVDRRQVRRYALDGLE